MTRDDVIRMAREAGFQTGLAHDRDGNVSYAFAKFQGENCLHSLEVFASLVAAADREARIKAQTELEDFRKEMQDRGTREIKAAYERGVRDEREACATLATSVPYSHTHADIATAIRARGT